MPCSTRGGLYRAHKCAEKLAINLARDRVGVDPLGGKKLPRILRFVDSRRLNFDPPEAGGRKLRLIVRFIQCAGHTANPQQDALANLRAYFAARYNVGYSKAAAWLQDPKCFAQHLRFVRGEIDHAI